MGNGKLFSLLFGLIIPFIRSTSLKLPLVLNTWSGEGFELATSNGFATLIRTNDRLLGLREGLSTCEREQCDGTVGFGGSPDESGETTLDALILDGVGQRMGAVGGMKRIKDAAKVAFSVMEYTKHSMLIGEGATAFAKGLGFKEENLGTEKSKRMNKEWKVNNCQPNFWQNVDPNPKEVCGPYKPTTLKEYKSSAAFDSNNHDTIGMIVIDSDQNIAAGTSTNGARNKIAGRVGDSPIPGAGAYVSNDVGAAVATGDGDIMMRFLPSVITVESMRNGLSPKSSAKVAIDRIQAIYGNFFGAVVAANKNGVFGAACSGMDTFHYSVRSADMKEVVVYSVECSKV
uniref:N(4)-(Beta-N-acetylglucosaminyl)-L-asparaginase n=1 Tax=Rhabditophanes sp. KR3021 TaxID=114890 RepID=A0AC35U006_9BILA